MVVFLAPLLLPEGGAEVVEVDVIEAAGPTENGGECIPICIPPPPTGTIPAAAAAAAAAAALRPPSSSSSASIMSMSFRAFGSDDPSSSLRAL